MPTSKPNHTSESGEYIFSEGDHICYRYEILKEVGKGAFGSVLKCLDHKSKANVAIKVNIIDPEYIEHEFNELKIL